MGRKGATGDGRKPRLALALDRREEELESNGHVSLAQEEQLKAIAHAAARAVGHEARTLITPNPVSATSGSQGFKMPAPKVHAQGPPKFAPGTAQPAHEPDARELPLEPVVATDESPTAGTNPLAGLLGYGADDGDEDSDAEPTSPSAHSAQETKQKLGKQGDASLGECRPGPTASLQGAAGGQTGSKDLDAELASFLSELETSGLLRDDTAAAAPAEASAEKGGEEPPAAAISPQPATAEPAAAVEVAPMEEEAPEAEPAQQEQGADGLHGSPGAQAAAADEAAEQRVLGDVPGAEGWCRVMDMGSSKVYFWHQETNEVAWEPPAGAHWDEAAPPEADMPQEPAVDEQAAQGAGRASEEQEQGAAGGLADHLAAQEPLPAGAAGDSSREAAADQPAALAVAEHGRCNVQLRGLESPGSDSNEEGASPRTEQDAGVMLAPAGLLAAPSEDAIAAAAAVAQRCTEAAGSWLDTVPQVVRLAIEAQSLSTLLSLFSQQQAAAVQAQSVEAAFTWASFESTLGRALAALDSQLPGAMQAALHLHASMEAAQWQQRPDEVGPRGPQEEEQEPPPLPAEPEQAADAASESHAEPRLQQLSPGAGATPPAEEETEEAPPPLPPNEVPMDLDDDEPAVQQSAAGVGSMLGLGGYGGSSSGEEEEEGEIAPPQPSLMAPAGAKSDAQAAAVAADTGASAAFLSATPAPTASYPYPYGAYLPPLPLPTFPPFHPLFLPPVGVHPPYPYGPYPGVHPAPMVPVDATAGVAAAPGTSQPPLPPEPQDAALPQARRREYSAQPLLSAATVAQDTEPLPLPVEQAAGPASHPAAAPMPPAQHVQQTGEDAMARKRKQEKAAPGSAAGNKKAKAAKLDKGTVSLINKWQAVHKQVQKLEEAEEAAAAVEADPEAKQKADDARRAREAEEWRLQQLRTGAVGENANFAPLVGDWRSKIKKPKKEKKSKKAAAEAGAAAASGVPDLDALSAGLPDGWRAMYDKASSKVYYGNLQTKETQWDRPT